MRIGRVGFTVLVLGVIAGLPAEARRSAKAPAAAVGVAEPYGDPTAPSPGDPGLQEAYPRVQALAVTQARLVQDILAQCVQLLQGWADGSPREGAGARLLWPDRTWDPVRVTGWKAEGGLPTLAMEGLGQGKAWIGMVKRDREARILVVTPLVERKLLVRAEVTADRLLAPFGSRRILEGGRVVLLDGTGHVLSPLGGRPLAFGPDALLPALKQPEGTFESSRSIYGLAKVPAAGWAVMLEAPKADLRRGEELPDENAWRAGWPVDPPVSLEEEGGRVPWWPILGSMSALGLAFGAWRMLGSRRRSAAAESLEGEDWDDVPLDPDEPAPLVSIHRDPLAETHREAREEAMALKQELQQQGRDHERQLGQLQQSFELTLEETRRQFQDILEVQQGRMKALAQSLEAARADLAAKAEGTVVTTTLEELRTRLFDTEAEHRQQAAGIEKRLSAVQKRLGEMDQTLGRAVDELQDKLSEDLLGRQEALARDMELLEGKTRETLRQLALDAAQAKLHGAQAAERAAELEGQFQQLRAKVVSEVEDVRRQALSDLSALRQQMHQVELVREELKDATVRFESTRADWEQAGALLHQRMTDELSAFQDRLFEREGQVEKLKLLVEDAVTRSERVANDAEWKRERAEKEVDLLKGRVFLTAESVDKLGHRLEECLDDVTGLHARAEQLQQETYRGREDLKEFQMRVQQQLADVHLHQQEAYGRLTQVVQNLVKQYQTSRDVDDRVTQALEEHERRMASMTQDLLAMRHVVQTRPAGVSGGGVVPAPGAPRLLP